LRGWGQRGSSDFVGRKEDTAALLLYRDVGTEGHRQDARATFAEALRVTGKMPVPLSQTY
jgi:hypothetical protein